MKGCLVRSEGMKIGPVEVIESLKEGTHYKFQGVLENIRQEDNLTLDRAAKVYQQRLSVVRLQQGPCNKRIRSRGTHIPNVDAGLADRRITKIGQSFKESYDREWGQASFGLNKIDISPQMYWRKRPKVDRAGI